MKGKLNNIKIVSTGKYLPKKVLTNKDFEKMVDTSDEWIVSRTGIKERHIVTDETTVDLAYNAALDAIIKADYDVNDIDCIIVATCTPDKSTPATANLLQARLGLNDKPIPCFDLSAACSGFLYAINVATQMLASGNLKSALVVGAERLSSVTDYTDRNTCVLFGDAAGAVILESTTEKKDAYFYTASSGDTEGLLTVDHFIHMDGRKVYQFAVKAMETSILKVLEDCNLSIDDIDMIIPHQANTRIIETCAKAMNVEMDQFFINIEKYGNTSAASVAVALDEYLDTLESKDNKKVLLVAFGGGFTWGCALLTL